MREKVSGWTGFAPRGMVPGGPRRVFDLGKTRVACQLGHGSEAGGKKTAPLPGGTECVWRASPSRGPRSAGDRWKDPKSPPLPLPGGRTDGITLGGGRSAWSPLGSGCGKDPESTTLPPSFPRKRIRLPNNSPVGYLRGSRTARRPPAAGRDGLGNRISWLIAARASGEVVQRGPDKPAWCRTNFLSRRDTGREHRADGVPLPENL